MVQKKKYSFMILLTVVVIGTIFYIAQLGDSEKKTSYNDVRAVVLSAEMEESNTFGHQRLQRLQVRLTSGPDSGKEVEAYNSRLALKKRDFDIVVAPGDNIFLKPDMVNGETRYSFIDINRMPHLYALVGVFAAFLLIFGRMIGLKSLVGLALTLIILWQGFLAFTIRPDLNIYALSLVFCGGISLLVILVVNGFSMKTRAAILGTWGGLAFASVLSFLAIKALYLTGLETDEAFVLKANILPFLDFRGILFASVIIGALGALIDVAVSIASAQYEIYNMSPEISWRELYNRGMNVGKDIMGAMSMTLVLAYVGNSLPLLLVMAVMKKQLEFDRVFNVPVVITEIVRALVGSIGLIAVIPLTALIMAGMLHYKKKTADFGSRIKVIFHAEEITGR